MPTYEYACELCGHQMEVFQSILAERLVKCPSCSGDGLKRMIGTGAGLIFKGTGFYETDYKKKSTSSAGNASAGEKSGNAPAASGSTSSSSGESAKPKPAQTSTTTTSN